MSQTNACQCGKTISANKKSCAACVDKPSGVLEILNVGAGDVKITYDKGNTVETIRAKRIIQDMLRRGFALVVEVERDGKTAYERVQSFDADRGEYIIADFDSLEAAKVDSEQAPPDLADNSGFVPTPKLLDSPPEGQCKCGRPAKHRGACRGPRKEKRLPMENTKATGIGRSAGG